jgi:4-hydroxybenzoyl-CoA thioesterase
MMPMAFASTDPTAAIPAGAFTVTRPIRFSHSDPAGIVYYPNYFDMFNGLVEDWFEYELRIKVNELLRQRLAMPIVHAESDFRVPSRFGDKLDLSLLVEAVGRSSLTYGIVGHVGGKVRLNARIVTAMISLDSGRAVPIPPELRDRFLSYRSKLGAGT